MRRDGAGRDAGVSDRHVRIELPAHGDGPAVVQVQGADVAAAVRRIEVRAEVGQATDVVLDLAATPVTFDGQARLWLPWAVVHLLADYGWTAPKHAVAGSSGLTLAKPAPVESEASTPVDHPV